MTSNYAPPPSASGALRSFQPDFPEEGEYATEVAPPPTYSAGFIGISQQQFPAVVQRAVPVVGYAAPPPQQTAVRPVVRSTNQLSGDGYREWAEAGAGGGSLSGLVHKNDSVYGAVDPYSYGEAPGHTGFVQRDRSSNGSSTNDVNFDPQAQAGFSMVGNKFRIANLQLNQYP